LALGRGLSAIRIRSPPDQGRADLPATLMITVRARAFGAGPDSARRVASAARAMSASTTRRATAVQLAEACQEAAVHQKKRNPRPQPPAATGHRCSVQNAPPLPPVRGPCGSAPTTRRSIRLAAMSPNHLVRAAADDSSAGRRTRHQQRQGDTAFPCAGSRSFTAGPRLLLRSLSPRREP